MSAVKSQTNQLDGNRDLSGKVAIVTGGSRGIGKAIALALADSGASLSICSRNQESNQAAKVELESRGAACLATVCDVRDEKSITSFIKQTEAEFGTVDILINNAGIYRSEPVAQHRLEIWQDVLSTNLTACLLSSRQVLPGMMEKNWGRIINISSVSGKAGEINGSAYCASKFGLIGLTQCLALEVARHGITVNALCPGWVLTDMSREQLSDPLWLEQNSIDPSESIDIARLSSPQMRFIEASEVASLALYLCRQDAAGITGQAINVCGGLSLH